MDEVLKHNPKAEKVADEFYDSDFYRSIALDLESGQVREIDRSKEGFYKHTNLSIQRPLFGIGKR